MTVLFAWLWQGTLIAVATAALLRLVPRLNAATRYVIWWMAVVAVVALPLVAVLLASGGAAVGAGGRPVTLPHALALPAPPDWLIACLAGIWLGTVVLGLARIALGVQLLKRLKRTAVPIGADVERTLSMWRQQRAGGRQAELRVSSAVAGACALGLVNRPLIVVSERLVSALDRDALDQIVMHEQAHLSRYDDWTQLLQSALLAVLGCHPALRFMAARIDVEREAACDDVVVARTGAPERYAALLADAADAAAGRRLRLASPIIPNAAGAGSLLVRVRRLLDSRVSRRGRVQMAAAVVGLSAFVVVTGAGASRSPLVVVLDEITTLPRVHGVPGRQVVDWAARGASPRPAGAVDGGGGLLRPRTPVRLEAVVTTGLSGQALQGAALDPDPEPTAPSSVAVGPGEAEPLPSTTILPARAISTDSGPVGEEPGWRAVGEAGVAIGQRFATAGTATGTTTRRAGSAVAGFFSRAGKAVAGSF